MPLFQSLEKEYANLSRGDALRACPWLSNFAPLALFGLSVLTIAVKTKNVRQTIDPHRGRSRPESAAIKSRRSISGV